MIDELQLTNLALISQACLEPHPRFTVITGETGSGKSALLSGFKLALGERGDARLIRDGQDALSVEARFFSGEAETIITRRIGTDGRSRVKINGSMAGVSELAQTTGLLIDLCGQHEHQRLLKESEQLAFFDAWNQTQQSFEFESYTQCFQAYKHTKQELDQVLAAAATQEDALNDARLCIKRFEEISPVEGELEDLEAELIKLEHAQSLSEQAQAAYVDLYGEHAALERMSSALSALEYIAGVDPDFQENCNSLREQVFILEDIARNLADYKEQLVYDPELIEQTQERIQDIRGLIHSYGMNYSDLVSAYEKAQAVVHAVDFADEARAQAQEAFDHAAEELNSAGEALFTLRNSHVHEFEEAVNAVLEKLEMQGARIQLHVSLKDFDTWTARDCCTLEFLFEPASGVHPRPLNKIASGGELSRVLLALKLVLGQHDTSSTLVFDEIDAGIGGSAARALGEVLSELSETHQLIVVTHLPQIAALGSKQYRMSKCQDESGQTISSLELLSEAERIDELARMLSGKVDDISRAHAQQLLQGA